MLITTVLCYAYLANFSGTLPAKPSIQSSSQQFLSNRVVVMSEWTLSNSFGRYQQLLLPNVSVSVIPSPEEEIMFIRSMSIRLTLPYNTLYNVSVTQPGVCGQPNQIAFIELNYSVSCLPREATKLVIGSWK